MGTTAHFINKNRNGNIFITKQELVNYILNRTISSGYNILGFNTIKEAENCKIALQNPLLRFTLAKLANNHSITTGCFKYVPNIDWSDPRVVTDEGLLEVCGCPKDKAMEYAEYCRKYMENFENG